MSEGIPGRAAFKAVGSTHVRPEFRTASITARSILRLAVTLAARIGELKLRFSSGSFLHESSGSSLTESGIHWAAMMLLCTEALRAGQCPLTTVMGTSLMTLRCSNGGADHL